MPETVTEQLSRAVIRLLASPIHICKGTHIPKYDCPRCQAEEQAERALAREREARDHE